MRIADHAPAMQASPVLQQPATSIHHQQVQAGVVAAAQAAKDEARRMAEVNESDKAENRPIRGEEQGRNRHTGGSLRQSGGGDKGDSEPHGAKSPPSEPGNGELLDVIV